ncbi:MAG: hypothetical protein IPG95_05400 [Saprospiraceae bacterium]|nr:hypothetical protein [Saprospiraceae bacterium]
MDELDSRLTSRQIALYFLPIDLPHGIAEACYSVGEVFSRCWIFFQIGDFSAVTFGNGQSILGSEGGARKTSIG